jgi:F-type H+-transporting ATPase subunit b
MKEFALFAGIGGDLADMGAETARRFGVDWPHFIAQCISFAIVAWLLTKFAYRPILRVLAERREQIAEGVANAEKIKQELAKTEAARKELLEQAGVQANKLIEEARAAAAQVQERETQKAVAAAEQIIAKAREAAQADHARMLAELRREVGRLVVQTTAKVTGKILTPEDQQRLSEETRREMAA